MLVTISIYLNGTLNWLAIHNNNTFFHNFKETIIEQFNIVSLDLGTETYNQYTMPKRFSLTGEIIEQSEQKLLQVELLLIIELPMINIGTMPTIMLKA